MTSLAFMPAIVLALLDRKKPSLTICRRHGGESPGAANVISTVAECDPVA